MSIKNMTATELGESIKKREIGVKEATLSALESAGDNKYNAFITICEKEALKRADEVQKGIDEGFYTSPLAGVPMAVKDNICTKDILTTCGSKILTGFRPTYNAEAYERLLRAGAVLIGKTNMDEFAMGSTTETSYYGAVKNPWNGERVAGGSSGGSAAAVASGEGYYALGSDTGGSVRQPCAFCGVTGIKPTYGTVSRYGLIAYASSLDQIAPIGKNVRDIAEVLKTISGYDKKDSTSFNRESMNFDLIGDIKGKRIGIPTEYFDEGLERDVRERVLAAAKKLEEAGAVIEEFSMPSLKYAVPAYYIIACAEASSNLSRYDGVKYGFRAKDYTDLTDLYYKTRSEGFGTEAKRRILIGTFVLSSGYYDAYYKKALKVKAVIKNAFDEAFEKYDAVLSPTSPTTAPKLGESLSDPLKMYLGDIYTVSVNLAGLPSINLPCGFGCDNMPVGLQLIGKAFSENTLLNIGLAYEQMTDFRNKKPAEREGI